MISSWNIHDFIFKTIFNNWQCSKQMSFFHSEYMYAVSNNLTVSKSLSSVVVMTFFIHNSEKSFETIEQKQSSMLNTSMISVVESSSDRTVFAVVDFLFKMIRVAFFLFLFFFVDGLRADFGVSDLLFDRYFFSGSGVRCDVWNEFTLMSLSAEKSIFFF